MTSLALQKYLELYKIQEVQDALQGEATISHPDLFTAWHALTDQERGWLTAVGGEPLDLFTLE